MKIAAKIHVGPVKVEDTQYIFFAKGVGKVAEIEGQRIASDTGSDVHHPRQGR